MIRTGFHWKILLFIFGAYVVSGAIDILHPQSFLYIYYHTLIAFHPRYWVTYLLAIGMVVMNILSLISFFLFVIQTPAFGPALWQKILFLRIIFDLTGHSAEIKSMQAAFQGGGVGFVSLLVLSGISIIPSYLACFYYAFRKDDLFWKRNYKHTEQQTK